MNIKRVALGVSGVSVCWLLLAGSGLSSAPQKRVPRKGTQVNKVNDLYRTNCARCHGAEGHGDTPLGRTFNAPDFTDQKWWQEHAAMTDTRSLAAIVTNGKGSMPGFSKRSGLGALMTMS